MLADIFGWDIDFSLDLRVGDSFQALVEKRYLGGKPAGYGHVLAAEFVNQGEVFNAIRFQSGDEPAAYYDEEGRNLRKAFLKAPLKYTRISSGYTLRRLHPVSKTWKPHPAIDFAAPIGTPVKTVGDGTVVRKGYGRGNGYYVEIRHANGYKSMYLHLSRFAKGLARGSRVKQGELIGYVGNTGISTGPHLDFRMTLNGKPLNPLTLKSPAAASISGQHMTEFLQVAQPLLARLDRLRQIIQVADARPARASRIR